MGADSWEHWQRWEGSVHRTLKAAQTAELKVRGYASLNEARAEAGESGTGSVLDITELSDEPRPSACWDLTEDERDQHFDSPQPARDAIESNVDELAEALGRGESLCVVCYAKKAPVAVYFTGWSYD